MSLGLEVRLLEVKSPEGRILLDLPHLNVPPGQLLAIRGASGAGKSTFLHAAAGLLQPSQGRLRWGTADLAAMSEAGRAAFRRENLGLVFQDFMLFEELTSLGNAALAAAFAGPKDRPAIVARARHWLGQLGVTCDGGRTASTFSGGERQRIAVARALAADPAVLLADEPTASLDRKAADKLAADLISLSRREGRTFIAVTHDEDFARQFDRTIVLADARIVADSHG